jgi:hypothetical protein
VVISIASSFVANKIWCVVVLTLVNATKELFLNYCRIPRFAQNASRIFWSKPMNYALATTLCMKHAAACKNIFAIVPRLAPRRCRTGNEQNIRQNGR